MVKDQTVTNFTGNFDISESFSFGIHTYRSGAIQLSGGNEAPAAANGFLGGNIAPTGDVDLDSTALLAKFALTDNVSVLGGFTQNILKDGNVTTLAGSYNIVGKSEMGYVVGAAYSLPEIALRVELLYQPKATISTTLTHGGALPGTAELSLQDTYALSFQTGIAADTLLLASYRKATWSKDKLP